MKWSESFQDPADVLSQDPLAPNKHVWFKKKTDSTWLATPAPIFGSITESPSAWNAPLLGAELRMSRISSSPWPIPLFLTSRFGSRSLCRRSIWSKSSRSFYREHPTGGQKKWWVQQEKYGDFTERKIGDFTKTWPSNHEKWWFDHQVGIEPQKTWDWTWSEHRKYGLNHQKWGCNMI